MWGDLVDVTKLDRDLLRAQRKQLGLSQKATAKLMYDFTVLRGNGATEHIALTGGGMGWMTESACLRAVQELEGGRRQLKEGHYVYVLLAVLRLQPAEAGVPPHPPITTLDPQTVAAVQALPRGVRGTMFNMHGEALVYALDDVVYHSDNWSGSAVHAGEAHDLVLDEAEKAFVRAMWQAGEWNRRRGG
jgi:hypothetical protein